MEFLPIISESPLYRPVAKSAVYRQCMAPISLPDSNAIKYTEFTYIRVAKAEIRVLRVEGGVRVGFIDVGTQET